MNRVLDRLVPDDLWHLDKFAIKKLGIKTAFKVEKQLILPEWISLHNQFDQGSCVPHATSLMLAILNEQQCREQGIKKPYIRYNPWWLWDRAKEIDAFQDTNVGDTNGTTVKAACEVLRNIGHVLWLDENDKNSYSEPQLSYGIENYVWANTVDEIRTTISMGIPLAIGINWYSKFNEPELINNEYWIKSFGYVEGGHSTAIAGASDEREAFWMINSWGPEYPPVWIPYEITDRLIQENGEFGLVGDRITKN